MDIYEIVLWPIFHINITFSALQKKKAWVWFKKLYAKKCFMTSLSRSFKIPSCVGKLFMKKSHSKQSSINASLSIMRDWKSLSSMMYSIKSFSLSKATRLWLHNEFLFISSGKKLKLMQNYENFIPKLQREQPQRKKEKSCKTFPSQVGRKVFRLSSSSTLLNR